MELIEYGNRPESSTAPVPNNYLGAAHVCFKVDDVRATKAELESKGVEFYSDVNVVDSGPLAGWRWVYFSDPDGLALELVEVAYYLKEEREAACGRVPAHPARPRRHRGSADLTRLGHPLAPRRARPRRPHARPRRKSMVSPTFGTNAVDWENRLDLDRLRRERLAGSRRSSSGPTSAPC